MEDTRKELERIQNELLKDETVSLEELLQDEELNALLQEPTEPAFDDPEKIHDPRQPMVYQNYANQYGSAEKKAQEESRMARRKQKDDKIIVGLMITASALCLGIIGVLAYWLTVFL